LGFFKRERKSNAVLKKMETATHILNALKPSRLLYFTDTVKSN
jgi:hypothetical protein